METPAPYKVNNKSTEEQILEELSKPETSKWFKSAMFSALQRDPVDAVNEAGYLYKLLNQRLEEIKNK